MGFADAYGYLSFCLFYGWVQVLPGFDDNLVRANELAEKGVSFDGTSAVARTRLGWIQVWLHQYDQAIANLENAVALAPSNAEAHAQFGQILNYWGDPERALEMFEKAFSIETFVPPLWEFYLGHTHMLLRQYDDALSSLLNTVERAPNFTAGYVLLACAYVELHQLDDAKATIQTALEVTPQFNFAKGARIFSAYRLEEERNRFLDSLRKAGLPE